MSCYHRNGHGCDRPVPPPDWYDAYGYRPRRYRDDVVVLREDDDDIYDEDLPRRRGSPRGRRRRDRTMSTAQVTAASLQSRAETLREELTRIEEDLATLSAEPGQASQT